MPSTCKFLEAVFVSPPARVEGTAVFLTAEPGTVPNACCTTSSTTRCCMKTTCSSRCATTKCPGSAGQAPEIESLGHDCWQVVVHYGFKNDPDLPKALQQIRPGAATSTDDTSYFLSRDIVIPTIGGGMAQWREKLFAQMHHNASGAADFLNLPNNAVVELGSKIEI
jgi:KUP system potassium uptake protein